MRNLKEDTIFCCGIDGKPFKLVPGKYSLYYRCPNYEFKERGPGKKPCMNRISLKDEEILLEELDKMRLEHRIKTGEGGKRLNLKYEITEVNDIYIMVNVINTFKIKSKENEEL